MISIGLVGTNRLSCRGCLLWAILFASFSVCAWSQTQLATVFGTITDPSGAVVPEAQVTIVNQSTGLTREALTDMTGQYRVAGLPTGTYAVRVEKSGFQTQRREGIALTSASEVMIGLSLTVGDQQQQVSVIASSTAIDTTTSTVGGLVAERSLSNLPLNGRDVFRAA